MKTIHVTLTEFIEGKSVLVDEHPVVNDSDYVDIVTTPNELHYNYDGANCCHSKIGATKNELLTTVIQLVLFDKFYEIHFGETFEDIGLPAPIVYDYEEMESSPVKSICNYIDNCKLDKNYPIVRRQLIEIAKNEIPIIIEDHT